MSKSTRGDAQLPLNVSIRGARQNNLKNVDVDIPRDKFVVFTGISGSGKSSLAFGTIYAESQRRYLESIAPYGRRLIEQACIRPMPIAYCSSYSDLSTRAIPS